MREEQRPKEASRLLLLNEQVCVCVSVSCAGPWVVVRSWDGMGTGTGYTRTAGAPSGSGPESPVSHPSVGDYTVQTTLDSLFSSQVAGRAYTN